MADGIYVGMAAAAARADQLESIADNLSNVETPGFKASYPAFQSFLPKGAGGTSDKVATAVVGSGADPGRGLLRTTENPLDVVPQDDGYLMVRTATGPALTRNGRLVVNPDGFLLAGGRAVIGASGNPIQIQPGLTPLISERGSVMAGGVEVDRLALFKIQGNIAHVGPSLYSAGPGGTIIPAPDLGVSTGQLELGNSTPLDATVQMISAQRQFETAMQAIQTYRRLDDRVSEVGRLR